VLKETDNVNVHCACAWPICTVQDQNAYR